MKILQLIKKITSRLIGEIKFRVFESEFNAATWNKHNDIYNAAQQLHDRLTEIEYKKKI